MERTWILVLLECRRNMGSSLHLSESHSSCLQKKDAATHFAGFNSVQSLSHVRLFATPWTAPARLPCPSSTPGACSNSCPLIQWSRWTISSSVSPFSSCLHFFPASGSFPIVRSLHQVVKVLELQLQYPMNIQDWLLTGLISLQPKGFSRVFSNTTVQKHWFFSAQLSLWSNSHIRSWLLKKP